MNTKEKVEVMQAWLDGVTIEISGRGRKNWRHLVLDEPLWDWKNTDYRIKPEPREWEGVLCNGELCFACDGVECKGMPRIKVREVIDEQP